MFDNKELGYHQQNSWHSSSSNKIANRIAYIVQTQVHTIIRNEKGGNLCWQ